MKVFSGCTNKLGRAGFWGLLLLCCALFAACGKDTASTAESEKPAATLPVLIPEVGPAESGSTQPASTQQTPENTSAAVPSESEKEDRFSALLPVPDGLVRDPVGAQKIYDYGGYFRKNLDQRVIYMTFCIAEESGRTDELLQILRTKNVPAAFFINGEYFKSEAAVRIVQDMLGAGHIVGSHSYKHAYSYLISDEDMADDFRQMEALLAEKLGPDFKLTYYRPAYGSVTERDLYMARELGYITVMFSFNYRDWEKDNQPSHDEALEKLKSGLENGAIFYLHVMPCNLDALPDFIDYAREQGYEFKRIDE
ncbi:MAG: polysaccharide deacetylase family protein [Lachnospiraceae bacterium]|nr:polysaccharide deacetylase family protein [Lachnospiraceae bacterium]